MRPSFFKVGFLLVFATIAPSSLLAGPIFGTNLVVNGNAEAGAGSAGGFDVIRPIPGWTPSGNFTVVQYTAGGGFPLPTDPGPANRGSNFFAGGPDNGGSSAFQLVDLSAEAATIDLGGVTFNLAGFLGGFASQGDNAILTASFRTASNAVLASSAIGPVTTANRGSATGLLFRSSTGAVPTGTRTITLTLQMTRTDGAYNDGYADNLSLVLTAPAVSAVVPEPSSLLVVLVGTGLAGVLRRRAKSQAAAV